MYELIKKVLKEYNQPFTISYFCDYSDILNESIYPSKKEIQDLGYEPEPISDEEESLIKSYLSQVNTGQSPTSKNFNPRGDGFIGIFKTKDEKENKIKFEITLKRHWFFRLHRTKDPKSKKYHNIVDPKPLECIELIEKNADDLAKFVVLKKPNPNVVWEVNGPNRLNFLMVFDQLDLKGTEYNLILTNQIKGADFFDVTSKNKLPLR